MDEIRYLISDASKKVDVETHVLRYWEEELGISIPRNEMGHRYYTEFHIQLFCQVKNYPLYIISIIRIEAWHRRIGWISSMTSAAP